MTGTAGSPVWAASAPPPAGSGWVWDLEHVRDLPRVRTELRRRLAQASGAAGRTDVAERLVLAFDEMASNALRHGGGTVRAAVRPTGQHWLIEVQDDAADRAPAPAVGRDPGQGGLGLFLIAELALEHGWQGAEKTKSVWAVLPRTSPE